jgi:hypothetical protein
VAFVGIPHREPTVERRRSQSASLVQINNQGFDRGFITTAFVCNAHHELVRRFSPRV